jgi:hypothetical protein
VRRLIHVANGISENRELRSVASIVPSHMKITQPGMAAFLDGR